MLCQTKRNIKIITNSCFIANYIRQYSSCQIILLGGYYQPNSEVTVGPLLKEMISLFHVNRVFVGTDGFNKDLGFMGKDMMRSEGVRYMADAAEEVVILTDSSKFSKTSLVHQLSLADVNRVITDQALDKQTQELLSSGGLVLDFVS